jgi:hypothetical protein
VDLTPRDGALVVVTVTSAFDRVDHEVALDDMARGIKAGAASIPGDLRGAVRVGTADHAMPWQPGNKRARPRRRDWWHHRWVAPGDPATGPVRPVVPRGRYGLGDRTLVGDVEFRQTTAGPQPDHHMRVSVQPLAGYAALNYTDNNDPTMSMATSYNPSWP